MEDNVPAGVGLADVVDDTTPQLGGALDSNAHQISWSKGSDVASANALVLGTDGNYFDITGTTAILSIGTLGIGTVVVLHFDGILTLTHQATDLILPGAADITTAAGDEAMFVEYASGDWRCVAYTKASGVAVVAGDYKPGGTDVAIIDGGTGQSSALSAFNNLKQAATTDATGVVELATDGESAGNVVVQGNDGRLSNARTPTTHGAAQHTDVTRHIVFPLTIGPHTGTLAAKGDYSVIRLADGSAQYAYGTIRIPSGFVSLVGAYIVLIPSGTGNLAWWINTDFAAAGEAYNTHSDSMGSGGSPQITAVTADKIEEIDVSDALTGIAAGDYGGCFFKREGANESDTVGAAVGVMHLIIKYTAEQ